MENTQKQQSMQVAITIYNQLGGAAFRVMTGTHSFAAGEKCLTMRLRRNKTGANYLRVTLTAMDDYHMEFIKVGKDLKTKASAEGIMCDQLESMFKWYTGLETRLF
jgi:hypothetical protein